MQKLLVKLFYLITILTLFALVALFSFVLYRGFQALSLNLIFGSADPIKALLGQARVFDGIYNAIVGSLFVVCLSIMIALPFGLLSGIYLSSFASKKVKSALGFLYEILASTPSIVIGLFGLSVTIFLHKYYFHHLLPSLIISALSLSILVMPYLVKMTEVSLDSIPKKIKNIGRSLGATPMQNLFLIELPYATKEIFGAIILAMGRAIEDTAVIMMTGAVAMAGIPTSVLQKYEALPFFIYHISSEYTDKSELNQGFGAALILLFTSLALFVLASIFRKLINKKGIIR
ncbi:PstA family ABC transporter permease [Sulfurospirillum sp. 1612]|uniref:PstA family ABC transporter permease n=1 Tax=Sulfurospirillum sp. 1612 TaxID=3094835 RepID=UPI002F95D3A0